MGQAHIFMNLPQIQTVKIYVELSMNHAIMQNTVKTDTMLQFDPLPGDASSLRISRYICPSRSLFIVN